MKGNVVLDKLKKIKPARLIILLFFVISNTFAWFIYATKIDNDISVHVKSWNVLFEAGENQITEPVNLVVNNVYPGMDDYTYEINAYNNSEVEATLSYELLEASVLGTQYITTAGRAERGEAAVVTDITSQQLENILANNYPFSITLSISGTVLDEEDGMETYTLSVIWPYEQNDDETDTYWGMAADTYKQNNPGLPSITLKVKIVITQNED